MMKLAAFAVGACASASIPPEVEQKLSEFEAKFGKNFDPSEREARLEIFAENLKKIETLQQTEQGTAVYSYLTPFADLSPEEFSSRTGFIDDGGLGWETDELRATDNLPDALDWREKGFTTHVKDQKQCGSCWAFSVCGNVEGVGFVETGKLVRVSEQQLVDCASKSTGTGPNQGCGGGYMDRTMKWMIDNNVGLEYEEDYVYKAKNQQCSHKKANEVLKIAKFTTIAQDEKQMAAALTQYGPLSVGVAAGPFQQYHKGILDQASCIHQQLDHGVTLIGFGSEGGKPYWTIRNSWGGGWGEKGHIRLARGKGMCGVQKEVNTASGVTIDDSRPEPPEPIPGPHCCETKNIQVTADCKAYCANHGGFHQFKTPGPYCTCKDGDGCTPFPECGTNVTLV